MVIGSVIPIAPAESVIGGVGVSVACFALNADQSVVDRHPRMLAEAVGQLKVGVVPAEEIPKSEPVVPVANVCVAPVSPFREDMPPAPRSDERISEKV